MSVVAFVPTRGGLDLVTRRTTQPARPVAYLVAGSLKMALPFAPVESTLGGLASNWASVERTGRTPLVRYKGPNGRTLSFDVTLVHPDLTSVEPLIEALAGLGRSGDPITLSGISRLEGGPWRMKGCGITVQRRDTTNAITMAKAALEFEEATDVTISATALPTKTGPLTTGVATTPKVAPTSSARQYTVKRGDSLWTIAKAFYGNPERWKAIASANPAIRNANLIYPGQVLTIPA